MTPQQIVGMASRLFALWLVTVACQSYVIVTEVNRQASQPSAYLLYGLPALSVLLALFLWFFPMFVAHKIVPRTHDANVLRIPAREATAAGAAILGLWVLVAALPHLFATLSIVSVFGGGSQFLSAYFTQERTHQLLAVLFQCALGLVLVVKPWWVASRVFPADETPS